VTVIRYTDFTDYADQHGFFNALSVYLRRRIRVIRVQKTLITAIPNQHEF
jgi:hypothetical protein